MKNLIIKVMAHVNTYLNFVRNTEEAFNFYKSVFGGEFAEPGISRFGDIPQTDGMLPLPEADKNLVMHVSLKILGVHTLMGTDAPESMGFKHVAGNNVFISLEPDTKDETAKLFKALSADGKVTMELQDTFWGAYYGSCTDKFGINWMFNFQENQNPYLKE
jgi:PhnB protein